ncbi:DEAD/DEAH box helicase [Ammoniphilus oxalaticus]|nr:DEAD/DEAH box helicase [Ammoniphilus oxalaticus]
MNEVIGLDREAIRAIFDERFYLRGRVYYKNKQVEQLETQTGDYFRAIVIGSKRYEVLVDLRERGYISAECSCPAFDSYGQCKHIVATMFQIVDYINGRDNQRQYDTMSAIIDSFSEKRGSSSIAVDHYGPFGDKETLQVEYILKTEWTGIADILKLELKVGPKRTYVVKEINQFLQAVDHQYSHYFTDRFSYLPEKYVFSAEDAQVIHLLLQLFEQNRLYNETGPNRYAGVSHSQRALMIPPMFANTVFRALQGRNWYFNDQRHVEFAPYEADRQLPLSFHLDKGNHNDFQFQFSEFLTMDFNPKYGWLIHDSKIYELSAEENELAKQLMRFARFSDHGSLPVASEQVGSFITNVLPSLKQLGELKMSEEISDQIVDPELVTKIWLAGDAQRLDFRVEFHYDSIVVDPFQAETEPKGLPDGAILMRDAEQEQALLRLFVGLEKDEENGNPFMEGEEPIFDFLYTVIPEAQQLGQVYLTDSVKALILPQEQTAHTRIDLDSDGGLLEVSFDMDGIERDEVSKLLRSVVEKRKYHRLSNGAFVPLQDEAYQTIRDVITEFHLTKKQLDQEVINLPLSRGLQVDQLFAGKEQATKFSKRFRRFMQDLKNPEMIDFDVPETLQATLRDYQEVGFAWFKTIAHYRLGGILADDMGLGKTLQAIAYLLSEQADRKHPALIVVPASLVYNWKREFEKFAPTLNVAVAYGLPEERLTILREQQADVLITSYPLLRQDIEIYQEMKFDSFILDEAQAIKNHLTKTAQAVKEVQATKRFALSGTPIENSLDELWSIFDAVLPGFFPSQKQFRAIDREKLGRLVRPFVLRRLKRDVLKELPEKIETTRYSELSKQQKQLYVGYLQRIQQETREAIAADGFDKSRMKILAGLTRLRQLCCHPSLFLEDYKGESGKFEQLLEIVENALENKRRILIFSQFTSMLRLIDQQLEKANIARFYLDGQTPSKQRVEMTERFNEGESSLFLISLKAGGTGLNLTGADTVILYDLWWNPAVEEQAAGRAHRMGQKNSVQVMRLIASGTIEEKIYELQQSKKELIEQVLGSSDTGVSSLSEQEVLEILGIEA